MGGSIAKGLGATVVGCLAFFVVCVFGAMLPGMSVLRDAALFAFFALGVAQLFYVIPLLIWAYKKGERSTAKGIWIAAGVTLLLNAACFGLVFSGQSRFAG
jgi:hypothetical protein